MRVPWGYWVAAAALVWVLLGLPVVPSPVAEAIGWRRVFPVEFALEGAVVLAPAAVIALRAGRWSALPKLWAFVTIAAVVGGATGGALMWASVEPSLQDVYYAVAHLHFVARMGALLSLFTLFYALFPRVSGLGYSRPLAGAQLALMALGIVGNFASSLVFVQSAMPKRYSDYSDISAQMRYVSTATALLTGLGIAVFLAVLVEAFIRRRPAPRAE